VVGEHAEGDQSGVESRRRTEHLYSDSCCCFLSVLCQGAESDSVMNEHAEGVNSRVESRRRIGHF